MKNPCEACGEDGQYSILLAKGPDNAGRTRYYIPNQSIRQTGQQAEVWFCSGCIRTLEDNFRATLLYLQNEHQSQNR